MNPGSGWHIQDEHSYTGEGRELHTAEHVVPALDAYVNWLKANKVGKTNLHTYRPLDPEMKLFVNDNFEPLALTPRSQLNKDGSVRFQTRSHDDKIKSYIANKTISGAARSAF